MKMVVIINNYNIKLNQPLLQGENNFGKHRSADSNSKNSIISLFNETQVFGP